MIYCGMVISLAFQTGICPPHFSNGQSSFFGYNKFNQRYQSLCCSIWNFQKNTPTESSSSFTNPQNPLLAMISSSTIFAAETAFVNQTRRYFDCFQVAQMMPIYFCNISKLNSNKVTSALLKFYQQSQECYQLWNSSKIRFGIYKGNSGAPLETQSSRIARAHFHEDPCAFVLFNKLLFETVEQYENHVASNDPVITKGQCFANFQCENCFEVFRKHGWYKRQIKKIYQSGSNS
ncbi:hypothetical protein ABPG72_001090 [Tetrahymena utriculariae]